MLAAGEDASDVEEDEEEVAPAVGSSKPKEMGVDTEQAEPNVGAEEVMPEPVETTTSTEGIAGISL